MNVSVVAGVVTGDTLTALVFLFAALFALGLYWHDRFLS